MALVGALSATTGITNESLRARMTGLLQAPLHPGLIAHDLRRLRLTGLIRQIGHSNRYILTLDGIKVTFFYTKLHNRLLRPLLAADQSQAPPELCAPCPPSISTSTTTSSAPGDQQGAVKT